MANKESNGFTYAQLYADCYRYLGITDTRIIKRMTIAEYKALRKGAIEKLIDDMELRYDVAYKTALAGSFDNKGKPIFKSFKDMFDRKRVERALLGSVGGKVIDPEKVERFSKSKAYAEAVMNGITLGEEETDGD